MQALPSRLAAAQRRRLAMCGGNRGMRASGREASMRPESRVSRGEAEKTKGRENQSPGPSFNMVRLQDQQSISNPLIQKENEIDGWNMNPQTYPQTGEPMRMRPSSEKLWRKSPIIGRPNRKLLEIWRYMLNSPRKPYWSRVQLSPSVSPKHSFTWRQSWR